MEPSNAGRPKNRKEQIIRFLNRYSVFFHALLSCALCLFIESASRHSVLKAFDFMINSPLVFLYNSLIIFVTFLIVYFFKRRLLVRVLISGLWIFLGTINGILLLARVTPFGYTDLKLVKDLFAMQNNYFNVYQEVAVIFVVIAFILFNIWVWKKGPKYQGNVNRILAMIILASSFIWLPLVTNAAVHTNLLTEYFDNIAEGYEKYGFVYGFSTSVVDRGMGKPKNYSKETIENIESTVTTPDTIYANATDQDTPNIIVVLLESFIDPSHVTFLECSEDPIPNFHNLTKNYTTGYLEVPVVGAGTANTEFEILTGMNMKYFGTGEYPYKTILKKTSCESIASDLSDLGYGTHVVHNNTASFYSRSNAFSKMGFDTFTSKELLNINELTPLGTWATDHVLLGAVNDCLNSTPDRSDFVYTITVQGHGTYPTEQIIENPEIMVSGGDTQEENYQWEYYINQIHEVDKFIGDLVDMLSKRDEKTMLVLFGDHLPSLNLTDEDMQRGSIFMTKYATWNNFELKKQDENVTAFQLLAAVTQETGNHEGTIFEYHQSAMGTPDYETDFEQLQYDILYGKRYAYNEQDLYPASDLVMGVNEITITNTQYTLDDMLSVSGSNFTQACKVYVNGEKRNTRFVSTNLLKTDLSDLKAGDVITVNALGSKSTILRGSNEYVLKEDAPEPAAEDAAE